MLVDQMGSPQLADSRLAEHLAITAEAEAVPEQIDRFWTKVEANLREGNVRLVEFLNEHIGL
jgi:hypothetical protein